MKLQNASVKLKDVASVGEKTVRAIVTAPTLDRDGDVIDTQSLKLPRKGGGYILARDLTGEEDLDIPLLKNHSFVVDDVIGSVRKAYINEAGELEVEFGISSRKEAQDMFTLLDEGHLGNSFSITIMYDYDDVDGNTIYNGEIVEISLVFRGSNRDARLLAVTKSLLKESDMSKDKELAEKLEALEKAKEEVESLLAKSEGEDDTKVEVEKEVEETESKEDSNEESEEVEDSETEDETEAEVEEQVEEEVEEETEEDEAEAESEEETKEKELEMEETQKSIATKSAATKVNDEVDVKHVEVKEDPNRHKVITAKQISAMLKKDHAKVAELNEQARELDKKTLDPQEFKKKELEYTDNTELYLAEQLDRDVEAAYGDFGNVGNLVTRVTLTESPKYSRIVRDDGVEFTKPGFAGTKDEDAPSWSRFTLEPKPFAVIVAWNDHLAEDAYINAYNEIVRDIAEAEAKLEDQIILTEAGETVSDGTVYPAQGLNVTISNTVDYAFDSTFVASLAEAYGEIQSADRRNLSVVMSGATWGKIALLQDQEGRPLWTGTGETIAMGALGNVNVRTTDVIEDDTIILGNYSRYRLASKGGLQLRQSSEAVVGDLNLFTDDASAVRAVKRLEGGVTYTNAFVKLVTTS
jgi:HK97 family phage major capsid protein